MHLVGYFHCRIRNVGVFEFIRVVLIGNILFEECK